MVKYWLASRGLRTNRDSSPCVGSVKAAPAPPEPNAKPRGTPTEDSGGIKMEDSARVGGGLTFATVGAGVGVAGANCVALPCTGV